MELRQEDGSRDWAEPGVYLVDEGVYRIPLPMPSNTLCAVNVYAITDGTALVLIDSGWALDSARQLLTAALGVIGADLADVIEFLVTHAHRDHYDQAVSVRREHGTRVSLGEHERETLRISRDPHVSPLAEQLRLLRLAGAGDLAAIMTRQSARDDLDQWEDPDDWLTPGTRTVLPGRALRVVHTPGHTAGHVVFDDATSGSLFTGDHVLPHMTPTIGYEPKQRDLPLRDYLDSLRLVRTMPDRRLLPAHGPTGPSVHRRVDELLSHHARKLDQMVQKIGTDTATANEIARRLTWTRHRRALIELAPLHQMLAVLETAAHLDLLAAQAQLSTSEADGVRYYRRT
jgi:glyoxylase-like metal-dependent hydrolase (beta-lactamase superfamily II)